VKKLVAILALPMLALVAGSADASWSICGQSSCTYQFHSPRVWFGFDCCAPGCCPAPAGHAGAPAAAMPVAAPTPWFNQFPAPAPTAQAPAHIPAPAAAPTTLPVSYQTGAGYAQPAQGGYHIPSYWYGR